MRLEFAVGETLNVSDIDSINTALDSLNEDNYHAILGDDNYIQTAWTSKGLFLVEYRDGSGYFRSTNEELQLSVVKQLFKGFYNSSDDWKNLIDWTLEDAEGAADSSSDYTSKGSKSGNFKEDIAEQLKRDAINWGKKKLKKFLKF